MWLSFQGQFEFLVNYCCLPGPRKIRHWNLQETYSSAEEHSDNQSALRLKVRSWTYSLHVDPFRLQSAENITMLGSNGVCDGSRSHRWRDADGLEEVMTCAVLKVLQLRAP